MYIKEYPSLFTGDFCNSIIKRRDEDLKDSAEDLCYWNDKDLNVSWSSLSQELHAKVSSCIEDYFSNFQKLVTLDDITLEGFGIIKQLPGTFDPLHFDTPLIINEKNHRMRPFVCLAYLNHKEFNGGQLLFPVQKTVITPEQGKVVIFPASYLFPHHVATISGGTRYFVRMNYMFKKSMDDTDLDHWDVAKDGVQKF